ncbi:hypothetical protein ACFL9U_16530, partial [Thermodesulfobacteriota bacterium]
FYLPVSKKFTDLWTDTNYKKNRLFGYFFMAASSADILEKLRRLNIPAGVDYALSVQAGANLVAPYAAF